jgi:hypothetical protein
MIPSLVRLWQRLTRRCATERFLIGASVFRLLAAFTILYQYLINHAQRRYLFGPSGVIPHDVFLAELGKGRPLSLYAWSPSLLFFEIVFHLGVLFALLWLVGLWTRWMTVLNYVFLTSLHDRFPGLWDGGDNVIQLILFYAMFANVGAFFSVDRLRSDASPIGGSRGAVRAMFHNAALLAIAIQISLVYGVAGLTKVQGETWRNGTALYYALRAGEFTWPGYSEVIYQNSVLIVVFSYATVAFQVSFPFMLFLNRYTRILAVCCGVLFHLGIASFMGLVTFALFLMSVDLALITDDEYRSFARFLHSTARRVTAEVQRRTTLLVGQLSKDDRKSFDTTRERRP